MSVEHFGHSFTLPKTTPKLSVQPQFSSNSNSDQATASSIDRPNFHEPIPNHFRSVQQHQHVIISPFQRACTKQTATSTANVASADVAHRSVPLHRRRRRPPVPDNCKLLTAHGARGPVVRPSDRLQPAPRRYTVTGSSSNRPGPRHFNPATSIPTTISSARPPRRRRRRPRRRYRLSVVAVNLGIDDDSTSSSST